MQEKNCSKCGKRKSISEFPKHKRYKDGRFCWCNKCNTEYQKEWKQKKLENNPTYGMNAFLLNHYNLTLEEYDLLSEQQNNVCAICEQPERSKRSRLSVDHNHETGEVRGLLCDDCNNILGRAKDKIEILEKAIIYLKINGKAKKAKVQR